VPVGGGKLQDALSLLLQYPPLWAVVACVALNLFSTPLPAAVDSITAVLAPANRPLMLLAAGMTLKAQLPSQQGVVGVWMACIGCYRSD
jgi:predicted permease